jgi:hypothetical protein
VIRGSPAAARFLQVVLLAIVAAWSRDAFAQDRKAAEGSAEGAEHTIVVGVGGAAELELRGGAVHPRATTARGGA